MKPAFIFLLFLSVTAVSLGATTEADQKDESLSVTDIIAKVNENIQSPLLQDDIMGSMERNAVPCTRTGCKWRKSGRYVYVPVMISSSYSRSQRNIIIRALLTFHRSTCIRFVWRRWYHRNYIYFYSGNGCWSYLGRQSRGQRISLMRNGCLYTGTIQHEVLHALGFAHEQVRSDRDRYVRILYQNIRPGKAHNFYRVQTNNLWTSYDFNSVMHYSKYAFSKNGQPTIVARSNPNMSFGRASYMSANDIRRVNRLYRCCEYKMKSYCGNV